MHISDKIQLLMQTFEPHKASKTRKTSTHTTQVVPQVLTKRRPEDTTLLTAVKSAKPQAKNMFVRKIDNGKIIPNGIRMLGKNLAQRFDANLHLALSGGAIIQKGFTPTPFKEAAEDTPKLHVYDAPQPTECGSPLRIDIVNPGSKKSAGAITSASKELLTN